MKDNYSTYSVRQGDVYLRPIDKIPSECVQYFEKNNGAVILAHGEATGHKHAIYDKNAILVRAQDKIFLLVMKEVDLKHEEHGTIPILPGSYEVLIGREFNYRTGKAQQEVD